MSKEIESIFANLPPNFFGSVEIHFKNGTPGFAKVTQSISLDHPNGKPQGDNDGHTCSNPRR